MRRSAHWFLLAGISLQLATPAGHAVGQVPIATPSDRAMLLRLEDDWARALVKRDRTVFQRMLAPGFVYTEDDRMSTRDEVLRDIISPGDTVTAAHNEGMQTHLMLGTGVVTGLLIIEGRTKGSAYVHRYRFTDTWVKQRDGSWKIYAAEDYLIPHR
jgi:ketosteroid isomerase-like protein